MIGCGKKVEFILAWQTYRVGDVIEPPATLRDWLKGNGYVKDVGAVETVKSNAGVTGAEAFLDDAIRNSPENNPPAGQKAEFIKACDQETQKLYDAIWTNLKK